MKLKDFIKLPETVQKSLLDSGIEIEDDAAPAKPEVVKPGWELNIDESLEGTDDRPPFLPWQTVFESKIELLSLKDVHGRKGQFYCLTFRVLTSSSAEVQVGSVWSKGFHYVPDPRYDAEREQNSRTARELGKMAAAVEGKRTNDPGFSANKVIGRLRALSAGGKPLGVTIGYAQRPYTSKTGKTGIGSEYWSV